MSHSYNPSTWEVEAVGVGVLGQPGLYKNMHQQTKLLDGTFDDLKMEIKSESEFSLEKAGTGRNCKIKVLRKNHST